MAVVINISNEKWLKILKCGCHSNTLFLDYIEEIIVKNN